MQFHLDSLTLKLKRDTVVIPLEDTTYFYGQMGAGKTSIARLIDYCLGGDHRLAVEKGAALPEVLIIDSPMKNISERENRLQFESFHKMLYELKESELSGTQMILIDKEYCPPPAGLVLPIVSRHMRPEDDEFPPLIPYYRGH
jgi:hypothetical protein